MLRLRGCVFFSACAETDQYLLLIRDPAHHRIRCFGRKGKHHPVLAAILDREGWPGPRRACHTSTSVKPVLSAKQAAQFRQLLESRVAELERTISSAKNEARAYAARHADPADQAASEYERQAIVHKGEAARQKLKVLQEALHRLDQGTYGECAECGSKIERKRLEAIPWALYCVACQETREHG